MRDATRGLKKRSVGINGRPMWVGYAARMSQDNIMREESTIQRVNRTDGSHQYSGQIKLKGIKENS